MIASVPIPQIIAIGAVCGLLSTLGIYFVPSEFGKHYILAAGTLRGSVVALLTAVTVGTNGSWALLLGAGAIYGAALGLMIALSHGKSAPKHILYIAPPSAIAGVVSGALIKLLLN